MKTEKLKSGMHPAIYLLLMAALLCASCGSSIVRGQAPVVRITELSHGDGKINLQLNIRNINGVDLSVQRIDFRLTADENEEQLVVYAGPVAVNITANGIESWSVETEESDAGRALLEKLEKGEIKSLPYQLKGSISAKDGGTMRFEHKGHLYPLPGRPGHFR